MEIVLAAVGKAKAGPVKDLFEEYSRRLKQGGWPLALKEIVNEKKEADALLKAMAACDFVIALDEKGENLTSVAFAQKLEPYQRRSVGIIIGGAEGLSNDVRAKANLVLSFGRLTWPHMLVRPLMAEQLYRAATILSGHPYHRA